METIISPQASTTYCGTCITIGTLSFSLLSIKIYVLKYKKKGNRQIKKIPVKRQQVQKHQKWGPFQMPYARVGGIFENDQSTGKYPNQTPELISVLILDPMREFGRAWLLCYLKEYCCSGNNNVKCLHTQFAIHHIGLEDPPRGMLIKERPENGKWNKDKENIECSGHIINLRFGISSFCQE